MDAAFLKVETDEQIAELSSLASQIWHECFVDIISIEQIDYMVETFQSVRAMTDQLQQGYTYFFIKCDGHLAGYIGFKKESDQKKLFLSKLYVQQKHRGKGLSRKAIDFLVHICEQDELQAIWLTVNRFNDTAIAAYKKMGFQTVRTQVADIGHGFVMDDYIMEKQI